MSPSRLNADDAPPPPFLDRALPCPVCGRPESHRDIRAQSYVEEAWDSDHRVGRYRWLNPAFAGIHPPFYGVWHCPACLYTDLKEAFQRPPIRPDRFVRLRLVFLRRLRDQDLVLFTLGSVLGRKERTFASALAAHLLAIYIQEMPPDAEQDPHKLARLYLRTAWLYREGPGQVDPGDRPRVETARDLARLQGALRVLEEFAGGPAEPAGPLGALRPQLQGLLAQARAIAEGLREEILSPGSVEGHPDDPATVVECSAEHWPAVPRNEPECLYQAVAAYQRYYEGSEGPAGSALAVLDLIVDLNRRLGAWDRVLRGAAELGRRALEERRELQQLLLTKKDLTETEQRRTRAKIESLGDMLDRTQTLSKQAERVVSGERAPASPG